MKDRIILFLILGSVLLPASIAAEPSPVDMVRDVYAKLQAEDGPGLPPDVEPDGPTDEARALYSETLIPALIENAKCWAKFDEGKEGSQLWVSGQDHSITDLKIETLQSSGDSETVQAAFKNFDAPQTWRYEFRRTDSGWRIDEIIEDGVNIRQTIKEQCG